MAVSPRALQTGARGGQFYLTASGRRVYGVPKGFATPPTGLGAKLPKTGHATEIALKLGATGKSKAAGLAKAASFKALDATSAALQSGDHSGAASQNAETSKLHAEAAKASRNPEYRAVHEQLAKEHAAQAEVHRKLAEGLSEKASSRDKSVKQAPKKGSQGTGSLSRKGMPEKNVKQEPKKIPEFHGMPVDLDTARFFIFGKSPKSIAAHRATSETPQRLHAEMRSSTQHMASAELNDKAAAAHRAAEKSARDPNTKELHAYVAKLHDERGEEHRVAAKAQLKKEIVERPEMRKMDEGELHQRAVQLATFHQALSGIEVSKDQAYWSDPRSDKNLPAQRQVRESLRSIIAQLNIGVDSGDGTGRYSIGDMKAGIKAYHTWHGEIVSGHTTHTEAIACMKEAASSKGFEQLRVKVHEHPGEFHSGLRAIGTLVHEEIHGTGSTRPSAYIRAGVGIEEAATEILARKAMRDFLGIEKPDYYPGGAFALPSKGKIGAYQGGQGAYDHYIQSIFTEVAKVAGDEGIHARIENAFAKTRTGIKVHSTPEEHVRAFVDALGLKREHSHALIERLSSPDGPLAPKN